MTLGTTAESSVPAAILVHQAGFTRKSPMLNLCYSVFCGLHSQLALLRTLWSVFSEHLCLTQCTKLSCADAESALKFWHVRMPFQAVYNHFLRYGRFCLGWTGSIKLTGKTLFMPLIPIHSVWKRPKLLTNNSYHHKNGYSILQSLYTVAFKIITKQELL